jgi:hypothetical protein
MADNVYVLPETFGPLLREYYGLLEQEPLPQALQALVGMIEAASAAHAGMSSDASASDQVAAREQQPDMSE